MPRCFFDVADGRVIRDETGSDFQSNDDIREHALSLLTKLVTSEYKDGDKKEFAVSARDSTGKLFFTAVMAVTALDICAEDQLSIGKTDLQH